MPHKLTHCIWCSAQSLITVIPAVCPLTVLRHSAWNSTIHLIMARLFSWGFTAKQNHSGLQQYVFIFSCPHVYWSVEVHLLGCILGWFGLQEVPCTSSFSLSKWPPSYKNLAERISTQGFQGSSGNAWRCVWLSQVRERSNSWHLMGIGQGCYQTSHSVQDGPLQ